MKKINLFFAIFIGLSISNAKTQYHSLPNYHSTPQQASLPYLNKNEYSRLMRTIQNCDWENNGKNEPIKRNVGGTIVCGGTANCQFMLQGKDTIDISFEKVICASAKNSCPSTIACIQQANMFDYDSVFVNQNQSGATVEPINEIEQ